MEKYADVVINRRSAAVDHTFTYAVPAHLRSELEAGMLVSVPFNREQLEAVVVRLHDVPPQGFAVREISDVLSARPLFGREMLALSAWIGEYYLCSRAAALQAMLPAGLALTGRPPRLYIRRVYRLSPQADAARPSPKRLRLAAYLREHGETGEDELIAQGYAKDFLRTCRQAGVVEMEERSVDEAGAELLLTPAALSPEQEQVYAAILSEQQGRNRPFLLHGVTGSGKTELYLRLIRHQAEQGRQSIVLVPEIALSPQMLDMLTRRLDVPLAVLHSGLQPSERRHIWQRIAEGEIGCVVGARSAVFAPLPNLGLIIIDEAHETSYKQDNTPRFSAVTVAEKRAELSGASLLLGSATPSVEQYWAAQQGRYALGELKQHYYPAPLPQVELVDMRAELRNGNKSIFSLALQQAIGEVLQRGEQGVLFLNRRGYFQHFACRDCGQSVICPHCAVAMSFHADAHGGRLKCHYCGRSIAPPQRCPICGSSHIRAFGVGTQRVADEVQKLFPAARVLRLDSDTVSERGSHERIYRAMRDHQADLLVGTQMVAKGLDLPRVTLSAVIAADTLLNLPDWRASERTFQLVTQLIGRAGRRDRQGLALIQTYTPDAPALLAAAANDYAAFYRRELEERDLHGYPPFTHFIRVLFTSVEREGAADAARLFAHYLREQLAGQGELCGPAEAPLAKLKDRYRRQLIVKCPDAAWGAQAVEAAAQLLLAKEKLPRDLLYTIDVDPFSVM